MKIYRADNTELKVGGNPLNIPVTVEAVHEVELMTSNHVKLSWIDRTRYVLPVGSYVMPFANSGDSTKYRLFEPYEPNGESECKFRYTPQFYHPVMWLSYIPFFHLIPSSDASDSRNADYFTKADKKIDWTYSGYVADLLRLVMRFIRIWGTQVDSTFGKEFGLDLSADDDFGGWLVQIDKVFDGQIINIGFQANDVLSALSSIASQLDTEYHFDCAARMLYFGRIAIGERPYELKVGMNVGVASVSRSKEGYCNRYVVHGGTTNMTQKNLAGQNVQSVNRLTLEPQAFPDSILDLSDEKFIDEQYRDILLAAPDEPMITGELVLDDVYPKMTYYIYGLRERRLYREGTNKAEQYSKWYCRIASCVLSEDKKSIVSWAQYMLTDLVHIPVMAKLVWMSDIYMLVLNHEFASYLFNDFVGDFCKITLRTGNGAENYRTIIGFVDNMHLYTRSVPEPEIQIQLGGYLSEDDTSYSYNTKAECKAFYDAIVEGQEIQIIAGMNTQALEDEYKTSDRIADVENVQFNFLPNYDSSLTSPLTGRTFNVIPVQADQRLYSDDDVNDGGFEVHTGEFEISFEEENGVVIPHRSDGSIYPREHGFTAGNTVYNAAVEPNVDNNRVSLIGVAVPDASKLTAQQELRDVAFATIYKKRLDGNKYTVKSYAVIFAHTSPKLFVGQSVTFNDGQSLNGGTGYTLDTRITKLITRLDHPEIMEISFGNKKLKGNIASVKEKVDTIVYGSSGSSVASSGNGTGSSAYSLSQIRSLMREAGSDFFLSKTSDDEAQGMIGFLRGLWVKAMSLFGIDGEGNGKLRSLFVGHRDAQTGELDGGDVEAALSVRTPYVVTDVVESDNFSGGEIDGTGYRLTKKNDNGHSYLEIDELFVRMKATFLALEVRKETFVGGNQYYSPAGSVVYRVDYMDDAGALLGYTEYTVPWFGADNEMLTIEDYTDEENRELDDIALGLRRRIKNETLTDAERSRLHHFRLYLIADDGTTQTRNMWQVGDQVRCQTYNRASAGSKEQTKTSDAPVQTFSENGILKSGKDGNNLYWRLVTGVGTAMLEDGKLYDYIELPYEGIGDNPDVCMPGSDWPVATDHIVCMGSRTNPQRMNMVAVETVGDNAPAIKMYRGINTFSLEGKRTALLSPSDFTVYASEFHLLSDSGTTIPSVCERSAWAQGEKYHYFDRVSHAGSIWLCIIADGFHWIDASGSVYSYGEAMLNAGESGREGSRGTLTGSGRGVTLERNYTLVEPSDAPDVKGIIWQKEVSKGTEITRVATSVTSSDSGTIIPTTRTWYASESALQEALHEAGHVLGDAQNEYLWYRRITSYSDQREDTTEYWQTRLGSKVTGSKVEFWATDDPLTVSDIVSRNITWKDDFSELTIKGGTFVWTRTTTTYSDGTRIYSYNVSRQGTGVAGTEELFCLGTSRTECPDTKVGADGMFAVSASGQVDYDKALWGENRPAYNPATGAIWLWNFELTSYSDGTQQATKPHVIANMSREIDYMVQYYALSVHNGSSLGSNLFPADITIPSADFAKYPGCAGRTVSNEADLHCWADERHARTPSDALPYQWNMEVVKYTRMSDDGQAGSDMDVFYHVSSRMGTKGEAGKDGDGAQYVFRLFDHELTDAERASNRPTRNGIDQNADGEWIPAGWSDDPIGATKDMPYEYVSALKCIGGTWGDFEKPSLWMRYSKDGQSVYYDAEHSRLDYAVSHYGTPGAGRQYPSDISDSSWQSDMPERQPGLYLWTRDTTAYNSGGTTVYDVTYGVTYWAMDGESVEIDDSRTFTRYSSVKTSSQPEDKTFTLPRMPELSPGDYLWTLSQIAFVGKPEVLKSYSVSRVGTDGKEGDPGADGYTTHFAYAQLKSGQLIPTSGKLTMSMVDRFSTVNFSGADAIGTYRDDKPDDIDDISQYTWTAWRGKDGVTPTVEIRIDGGSPTWFVNGISTGVVAEGKDGTGVQLKGVFANASERLSSTGHAAGDCYIQEDNRHLYFYTGDADQPWRDLGVFRGDDGKSSYLHMAWADDVRVGSDGALTVTGFSLVNTDGHSYAWIGLCVDESEADPESPASYEWNYQRGADGEKGSFKSWAFIRTNSDISNVTPTGGTYDSPVPTSTDGGASWHDGIPTGDSRLWQSFCTFKGDGTSSGWSKPAPVGDTQDNDIEFAFDQPNGAQPADPTVSNRHGSGSGQLWYDPDLDRGSLPSGKTWSDMVWRAERETKNGVEGPWVISRIKGEKGDGIDWGSLTDEEKAEVTGQDGLTILVRPQAIIVNETTDISGNSTFSSGAATATISVQRGGEAVNFSLSDATAYGIGDDGTVSEMVNCADAAFATVTLKGISRTLNASGKYEFAFDHGRIDFVLTVEGKSYSGSVAWFLNAKATYRREWNGEIERALIESRVYELDANGNVKSKTSLYDEVNGAKESVRRLETKVEGQTSDLSEIRQTSKEISLVVEHMTEGYGQLLEGTDFTNADMEKWQTHLGLYSPTQQHGGHNSFYYYSGSTSPFLMQTLFDTNSDIRKIEGGKWYTLSFWAKVSGSITGYKLRAYLSYYEIVAEGDYSITCELTTEWQQFVMRFRTDDEPWKDEDNLAIDRVELRFSKYTAFTGYAYVCEPRLEEGETVHGYDEVYGGLNRTGIDIVNGRIAATADTFEVRNQQGDATMTVDEEGNLATLGGASFRGTVRADNFFRQVCLVNHLGTYYFGDAGKSWRYVYSTTGSSWDADAASHNAEQDGVSVGDYLYTGTEYDGTRACTYNADLILLTDRGSTVWTYTLNTSNALLSTGAVLIPRASDFKGKTIEIRHTQTSGSGQARVMQVDNGQAFIHRPEIGSSGITGYPYNNVMMNSGDTLVLYSTGDYWLVVGGVAR